ncbi:MAG TPA: putative baseplate assembly protein [Pyrinomonadaceae bacterium]
MTLPQPNLDDKTFAALVAEATKLIPRHAPEWTDHNRHDPGITFVELFSWLAEMQQFYLNRVGDESRLKFLKLLGIRPRGSEQALAAVTFSGAADDGLVVPRGTKLSTAEGVTFETGETLRVVAARLKKVLSSSKNTLKDNTESNGISGLSFYAFGEDAGVGRRLYVGLDRALPANEDVFLTVKLYEGYRVARGSHGDETESVVPSALVGWEYYGGGDWRPLGIVSEVERALSLTVGDETTAAAGCFKEKDDFIKLVRASFAYEHLPASAREFLEAAVESVGTPRALRRALYDTPFLSLKGDETSMLSRSGRLRFTAPPDMAPRLVHPFEDNLYWLRATVLDGAYELPPRIETIRLNTVPASHRDTSSEIISFTSDGRPNQTFEADSYLAVGGVNIVQVREHDGRWKDWEEVDSDVDLEGAGPNDERYSLKKNTESGKVRLLFGDGVRGRIPPEGRDVVRLVSYPPSFEEPRVLGRSNGLPNQTFTFRQTPVVPETLVVQVAERARAERVSTDAKEVACLLRFSRSREFAVWSQSGPDLCEIKLRLEAKQDICNVEVRERPRGALKFRPDRGSKCEVTFEEDVAVFSFESMRAGEVVECDYYVEVGEGGGNVHGEVVISLAAVCPTVVEQSPSTVVEYEPKREQARWRDWTRVDDFDASGPDDAHFVLDSCGGQIHFGDGVNGDIPPAPASESEDNVRVVSFQTGGGSAGNLSALALESLARPFHVEIDDRLFDLKVEQRAAASGGLDREALEDAEARARRDLKTQFRAVTDEDLEYLALNTPGLRVARARAIPLYAPGMKNYPLAHAHASVSVVVVPYSTALRPFPSEGFVQTVCRHLDRHRLLTTRVYVIGPEYVGVSVRATVKLFPEFGQTETLARVQKSLDDFLRPLPADDDPDAEGWPFGRTVYRSEIYQLIESVEGVDCVEKVTLAASGVGVARSAEGNILIPPQSLVYPAGHSIEIVTPQSECRSAR